MALLTTRPQGWVAPAALAPMPVEAEAARGITVTDRAVLRDGVGWVPVSGELHYSRLPRARWRERLRQLRADGVTVASTYVFWLHHSPARGVARFDGNLDVGAFVDLCAEEGLDLALRIGPWVHGEARNGGFPDWVQQADVDHRSDDPRYLELVAEWFGQLAEALAGRAHPGGPVIAIQLENELYDRPEHLLTLKRLARDAGIAAPLWTATAWGGAELPPGEVMPLFGGYADGFWVDPQDDWHPTFRAHFFPTPDWDDPGVGADVREALDGAAPGGGAGAAAAERAASARGELHGFPPATCELGSGMATAYHRRPVLTGRDIAALAQSKIGNGSAWQGYFMYVGGANPARDMQETQATGYPNDMPELGYDFHAPIGESGDLADPSAMLRDQHAFLAAFGPLLAESTSTLPDERPRGLDDRETLRWAVRADVGADSAAGFAIITHHQPHEPVMDVPDVQLRIAVGARDIVFPSRPVTIPSGTLARWPFGLRVGQGRLDWATASAVTVLHTDAGRPTLVLREDAGIPIEIRVDGEVRTITPGLAPVTVGAFDVLALPADTRLWVVEHGSRRRLLSSDAPLTWDRHGRVSVRGDAEVTEYGSASGAWQTAIPAAVPLRATPASAALLRAAGDVPADHGFGGRRHRAPSAATFDAAAAVYELDLPGWAFADGAGGDDGDDRTADPVLDIDWAGDVAQLRVDDAPVDDRFWDGTRWSVALRDVGVRAASRVTLHVLPLHSGARGETTLALPAAARHRLAVTPGIPLIAIDALTVRDRGIPRQGATL